MGSGFIQVDGEIGLTRRRRKHQKIWVPSRRRWDLKGQGDGTGIPTHPGSDGFELVMGRGSGAEAGVTTGFRVTTTLTQIRRQRERQGRAESSGARAPKCSRVDRWIGMGTNGPLMKGRARVMTHETAVRRTAGTNQI